MDRPGAADREVRIAAIDIGTNTFLLLIADMAKDGRLTPLHHEQRIPRIGRDVDGKKSIPPEAFGQASSILKEYIGIARRYNTDRIVTAATSAVRDAANRKDFLTAVQRSTGVTVTIVSGEDEGRLTFFGALSGMTQIPPHAVVIDIGGGSTEIISGESGRGRYASRIRPQSYQLGAVRLTERYFHHNPPLPGEISAATKEIDRILQRAPLIPDAVVIGVAGTVTTLACLELGLRDFDLQKISGYRLGSERIAYWSERLLEVPTADILTWTQAAAGRADILPAGALILDRYLKYSGAGSVIVSERGLRYGLVMRAWEEERKVRLRPLRRRSGTSADEHGERGETSRN